MEIKRERVSGHHREREIEREKKLRDIEKEKKEKRWK